ncbi:MAG: hypothetical protein ACPG4U_05270 [Pseudomonadales bacterium]
MTNPVSSTTSADQPSDINIKHHSYGIYWILFALCLTLLALTPSQAPWITTSRGWFIQPMFGSTLGITIIALFSAVRVIQSIKAGYLAHFRLIEALVEAVSAYRTAIFSALLFYLYVQSLPVIGFVLASLVFVITLLWLSRLLNRTWLLACLFTLIAMVLIFRVAVSLWLPDVWLYSFLPAQLSNFANQYL